MAKELSIKEILELSHDEYHKWVLNQMVIPKLMELDRLNKGQFNE